VKNGGKVRGVFQREREGRVSAALIKRKSFFVSGNGGRVSNGL
jgi:hypothetical protein